jgi:hypothetical protein
MDPVCRIRRARGVEAGEPEPGVNPAFGLADGGRALSIPNPTANLAGLLKGLAIWFAQRARAPDP